MERSNVMIHPTTGVRWAIIGPGIYRTPVRENVLIVVIILGEDVYVIWRISAITKIQNGVWVYMDDDRLGCLCRTGCYFYKRQDPAGN
jgi:hypothetical protein